MMFLDRTRLIPTLGFFKGERIPPPSIFKLFCKYFKEIKKEKKGYREGRWVHYLCCLVLGPHLAATKTLW
jgi:hypothetical protein